MEMQTCTKCGQAKPFEQFAKHKNMPTGYLRQCKECKNAYLREYYKNNEDQRRKRRERKWEWRQDPTNRAYENAKGYEAQRVRENRAEVYRRHLYKKNYGMTIADYDRMADEQGHGCAICHQPPSGKHKYFHIDHCHTTGKVRALLCSSCNTALGSFKDDENLVLAAAAYLERCRVRFAQEIGDTMAFVCSWCGSTDTMPGFDQAQCLNCGRFTTAEGDKTVPTSEANEGVTVDDLPSVPEVAPEPVPEPEPVVSADEASEEAEPEAPADTPDE